METVAQRYARLRAEVPAHVAIVAVSKLQPAEAVREALRAGVTDVGENYVQEARKKFALADFLPPVRRHFIGHVQTNKARAIAATFDMVQTVDRPQAAEALEKAAAALGKVLPVLLQVNISQSDRFGCSPAAASRLAMQLRGCSNLRLDGVMAIGPLTDRSSEIAAAFTLAASVWQSVGGPILSIGMSGDWREAVAAGSTMIRLGSSIFGPRPVRAASNDPG